MNEQDDPKREQNDPEHQNEGEGSRTAARRYGEGVRRHLEHGKVEAEAEEADRALDTDGAELRRAEDEGRSRSKGEAPGDLE